jgi:ubiquinone/menaquinone biosynthesis C-methylase UbiE
MQRIGQASRTKTQGLYDRIADVQNVAMKLNGYRASVAKYLRSLDLELDADSTVLDSGCGTGIVSLAFQDAGLPCARSVALDLSYKSLKVAREEFDKRKSVAVDIDPVQGNILQLPFADNSFDLVMMCGVLEYTPLDAGLRETARVLKPGAPLVLLPVKPSLVGSMLEILYDFKIHPLNEIRSAAATYFNVVGRHKFPPMEPIGWSKMIVLLEKK